MNEKYVMVASLILIMSGIYITLIPTTKYAEASWANIYNNTSTIFAESNLVIIGKAVSCKSYIIDDWDSYVIFTDYTISIQKIISGKCTNKSITVTQTGGSIENEVRVIHDDPLIIIGQEMVLFLTSSKEKYFITGGPQGRFPIIDGKVYSIGEVWQESSETTKQLRTGGIPLNLFVNNLK